MSVGVLYRMGKGERGLLFCVGGLFAFAEACEMFFLVLVNVRGFMGCNNVTLIFC